MRTFTIAAVAALVLAGSGAVYAQQRHGDGWFGFHHRFSSDDRAAFVDARIAAVKAGLKLTPEQDKLWPPVEAAVRDFAKMRIDRAQARMNAWRDDDAPRPDPVTRLRERAEALAANAAALRRIADAADPLYKTLDDGQKRRLAALTRHGRGFEGMGHRFRHHDRDDGDRPWRRGPDREPAPDRL